MILKLLEDILGITALKGEVDALKLENAAMKQTNKTLWEQKNDALSRYGTLSSKVAALSKQLVDTIAALDDCKKLSAGDKVTLKLLQDSNLLLQAQLATQPASDLFAKEPPRMLDPAASAKVMLGQFKVKTVKWETTCTYPSHASIFMPCPIFEAELTAADCNRRRPDLTSIQICKALANVAQTTSSYVTDSTLWGMLDSWTPAVIVRLLRQDDCESLATRIVSLIQYYQLKFGAFKDYQAFLGLGYFTDNGNQYGHGFVVLLKDDSTELKDQYIIEATDNFASEPMKLSDVQGRYDCDWGVIGFPAPTHPEGSYLIKNDLKWWRETGMETKPAKEGILGFFKRIVGMDKGASDNGKKEALDKFAKERRAPGKRAKKAEQVKK